MLQQRALTAVCLILLVLAGLFLLPLNLFALAVWGVFLLAAQEWVGFLKRQHKIGVLLRIILLLQATQFVIPIDDVWNAQHGVPLNPFVGLILLVAGIWWLVSTLLILTYPRSARLWSQRPAFTIAFGLATLIPFFWSVVAIRSFEYQNNPITGAWLLLFVMALVWATDTGAYFVGKKFGKHKMSPHVSPNKTIEGMLGGVALAMSIALVITLAAGLDWQQGVRVLISSLMAIVASVVGDLSESMLKREAGIKDSGTLLPGHGGVLDRIDSLTAALPIFLFTYLLQG